MSKTNKIIMAKGLPASGKTTWAKKYIEEFPNTKRVNKDDLRAMLDNSKWSKHREKFILKARDLIVRSALAQKMDVIVDDTNLSPMHEEQLREIAREWYADFEVKDFTSVSLKECLERDSKRQDSVGRKVIRDMYNRHIYKRPTPIPYIDGLPECYVFDIDGTLALMRDRTAFEWNKVGLDVPNKLVVKLYRILKSKYKILVMSGRDGVCLQQTQEWLEYNVGENDGLFMRKEGDNRKDSIVKEELYKEHIQGKYNVMGIFDDRNQVVDMWRSLGLTCFQVAEGDF